MKPAQWFAVCKKAVLAWSDDFAPSMGAAISYYTMFSLAPLLVLVIAVAGLVFGAEAVQGQIASQLSSMVGADTAKAVQAMVKSAAISGDGVAATAVSIAVLLVGATSVFAELQSALDRIWHVPEAQKPSGIWGILRARVFSFGLILGLAFLLMVSLAVSAGLAAFGTFIGGLLPGEEFVMQVLNLIVLTSVLTVLFAVIFKLMPTARVEWRDVRVGALVTAVLFELGKTLIGLYLGKSGMANSFAGAGSLVVLLAWVYYAAQIFLLGAEFTRVYAEDHGSAAQGRPANVDGATAPSGRAASARPAKAQVPVPATPTDLSELARSARVRADLDKRIDRSMSAALHKLLLLSAVTAAGFFAEKRLKALHRDRRAAARR